MKKGEKVKKRGRERRKEKKEGLSLL